MMTSQGIVYPPTAGTWSKNGWGGPEWEASRLHAEPRQHRTMPKPRMIVQPVTEGGDEDDEKVIKEAVKMDENGRFGRVELIWFLSSEEEGSWVPFVPVVGASKAFEVEEPDDRCLFILESRRAKPKEDPTLYVSFKSETLINVLRSITGFQALFHKQPKIVITQIFSRLWELNSYLKSIESLSKTEGVDEDLRRQAHSHGILRALDPDFSADNLIRALVRAAQELAEFIRCLKIEFESTRQLIAQLKEHGQILYEHLIYSFEPGEELVFQDKRGYAVCFRVRQMNYAPSGPERESFYINGVGLCWGIGSSDSEWDNDSDDGGRNHQAHWFNDIRGSEVEQWRGTRPISELPFQILTDALRRQLQERGRAYVQYALGIHHVSNRWSGPKLLPVGRTIVDPNNGDFSPSGGSPPLIEEVSLHLLPPTIPGFSLVSKEFGHVHVLSLAEVIFDENAWEHLVLDADSKTLIKSLVEVTQVTRASQALINDVISGKGGGLIGVLHGPPGTGKTLTAEAVAEHLRRPLYMISAGELSLDAKRLEEDLKDLLKRATNWNAVMLIDEADVFLEQRSHHELQRNAVVSVTLKLFEYHQGVLFLTTNRITAFDEAFLSRFSIAIRYPDLDLSKRRVVWRKFLDLAGATHELTPGRPYVSPEDIDKLASKTFNGRTVKNLVRTAQALALAQNELLSIEHIQVVARVSERFLSDFKTLTRSGVDVEGSKNVQTHINGLDSYDNAALASQED